MRRGLSMIELLVAMGIAAVVSLVLYTMFASGLNLSNRFLGEETVFRRAYVIADKVSGLVHESDLTLATYSNDSPAFVAFPAGRTPAGQFQTDPKTGLPAWTGLWLLYADSGKLRLRSLAPADYSNALPALTRVVQPLGNGQGELLTHSLDKFKVGLEQVEVVNDPIAHNHTVPGTQSVAAILHLEFSLLYHDRRGEAKVFRYADRIEGRNSYASHAPAIPPTPTATPAAPAMMPIVPKDWTNS